MTTNNSNIISLKNWKEANKESREEASLLNYLKALSFHDLMNEAESARKELNSGSISEEVALKSKTILKEFTHRLKSDGLSANLKLITDSAEGKILKLKNLIK